MDHFPGRSPHLEANLKPLLEFLLSDNKWGEGEACAFPNFGDN